MIAECGLDGPPPGKVIKPNTGIGAPRQSWVKSRLYHVVVSTEIIHAVIQGED